MKISNIAFEIKRHIAPQRIQPNPKPQDILDLKQKHSNVTKKTTEAFREACKSLRPTNTRHMNAALWGVPATSNPHASVPVSLKKAEADFDALLTTIQNAKDLGRAAKQKFSAVLEPFRKDLASAVQADAPPGRMKRALVQVPGDYKTGYGYTSHRNLDNATEPSLSTDGPTVEATTTPPMTTAARVGPRPALGEKPQLHFMDIFKLRFPAGTQKVSDSARRSVDAAFTSMFRIPLTHAGDTAYYAQLPPPSTLKNFNSIPEASIAIAQARTWVGQLSSREAKHELLKQLDMYASLIRDAESVWHGEYEATKARTDNEGRQQHTMAAIWLGRDPQQVAVPAAHAATAAGPQIMAAAAYDSMRDADAMPAVPGRVNAEATAIHTVKAALASASEAMTEEAAGQLEDFFSSFGLPKSMDELNALYSNIGHPAEQGNWTVGDASRELTEVARLIKGNFSPAAIQIGTIVMKYKPHCVASFVYWEGRLGIARETLPQTPATRAEAELALAWLAETPARLLSASTSPGVEALATSGSGRSLLKLIQASVRPNAPYLPSNVLPTLDSAFVERFRIPLQGASDAESYRHLDHPAALPGFQSIPAARRAVFDARAWVNSNFSEKTKEWTGPNREGGRRGKRVEGRLGMDAGNQLTARLVRYDRAITAAHSYWTAVHKQPVTRGDETGTLQRSAAAAWLGLDQSSSLPGKRVGAQRHAAVPPANAAPAADVRSAATLTVAKGRVAALAALFEKLASGNDA